MENNRKKSHSIIFTIIGILGAIGLGAGIYFLTTGSGDSTKPKKEEPKEEPTTKTEKKEIDLNKIINFPEVCELEKCTYIYTLNFESEKVELVYELTKIAEGFSKKLKLNNKIIHENSGDSCGESIMAGIIGNSAIISYNLGCDASDPVIVGYDTEGVEKLRYDYLDENFPYSMHLASARFEIKDNAIVIEGTRLTHGPSIIIDADNEAYICNEGSMQEYGVNDNTIVQGKYHIKYESDNIFIKPTLVESTTFRQYLDKNYENGKFCEE